MSDSGSDSSPTSNFPLGPSCRNFVKLIQLVQKDSAKLGVDVRQKYSNLSQGVESFMRMWGDCNDETLYYSFPLNQCTSVFHEGAEQAKTNPRVLSSIILAIQQLLEITKMIYSRLCMHNLRDNGNSSQLKALLEKGRMGSSIADIFDIFEIVTSYERHDESLMLKNIQALLTLLNSESPLLLYPHLVDRAFNFLAAPTPFENATINSLFRGGLRQLVSALAVNSASDSTSQALHTEIANHDIIVNVIGLSLDALTGRESPKPQKLAPETGSDLLQIIFDTLPRGAMLSCQPLKQMLQEQLLQDLKAIIENESTSRWGYSILASFLRTHGYFWQNHCRCFGEEPNTDVAAFEALVNVKAGADDANWLWILQFALKLHQSAELQGAIVNSETLGDACVTSTSTGNMWLTILNHAINHVLNISEISQGGQLENFYSTLVPLNLKSQSPCLAASNGNGCKVADAQGEMDPCASKIKVWNIKSHRWNIEPELLPVAKDSCAIDMILFSPGIFCCKPAGVGVNVVEERALFRISEALNHLLSLVCGGPLELQLLGCLSNLIAWLATGVTGDGVIESLVTALVQPRKPNDRHLESLHRTADVLKVVTRQNGLLSLDRWYPVAEFVLTLVHVAETDFSNAYVQELMNLDVEYSGMFFRAFTHLNLLPLLQQKYNSTSVASSTVEELEDEHWLDKYCAFVQRGDSAWDHLLCVFAQYETLNWHYKDVDTDTSANEDEDVNVNEYILDLHFRYQLQHFQSSPSVHAELGLLFNAIAAQLTTELEKVNTLVDIVVLILSNLTASDNDDGDGVATQPCDEKCTYMDAGVCILEYISRCDGMLCTVVNACKKIIVTCPGLARRSKCLVGTLVWCSRLATSNGDLGAIGTLVDVFGSLIEGGIDIVDLEGSATMIVDCLCMLASTSDEDVNLAFRAIGHLVTFADAMVGASATFGNSGILSPEGEAKFFTVLYGALVDVSTSCSLLIRHCAIKSLALFVTSIINVNTSGFEQCCSKALGPLFKFTCTQAIQNPKNLCAPKQTLLLTLQQFNATFQICKDANSAEKCRGLLAMLILAAKTVLVGLLNVKGSSSLPGCESGALGNAATPASIQSDNLQDESSKSSPTSQADTTLLQSTSSPSSSPSSSSLLLSPDATSYIRDLVTACTSVAVSYIGDATVASAFNGLLQVLTLAGSNAMTCIVYTSLCTLMSSVGIEHVDALLDALGVAFSSTLASKDGIWPSDATSGLVANLPSTTIANKITRIDLNDCPVPPWLYADYKGPLGSIESLTLPQVPRVKLAESSSLKVTLRTKIANSVGILQDMQLLQLVTLHHVPNLIAGTNVMDRVVAANFSNVNLPGTATPTEAATPTCRDPCAYSLNCGSTILGTVATDDMVRQIIANAKCALNEPCLFETVAIAVPEGRVFDALARLGDVSVFARMSQALSDIYLRGKRLESDLALVVHFIDRLCLALKMQIVSNIENVNANLIGAIIPLALHLFELLPPLVTNHPYRQVYILAYQALHCIAKCVYCALYILVHFVGIPRSMGFLIQDFWDKLACTCFWFATLNDVDVGGSLSYTSLLDAITTEAVASLVVAPFSIAPPRVYSAGVQVLDYICKAQGLVLQRVALQRLSDAASFPFVAVPLALNNCNDKEQDTSPKSSRKSTVEISNSILLLRARLTCQPMMLLAQHLTRLVEGKNELQVHAAIGIVENIVTLPGNLTLAQEPNAPSYAKAHIKRPLLALVVGKCFAKIDCKNPRVARSCKRLVGLFLQDIGAT